MVSGLESYDNGQKNTWRGWQWNRIVERLPEFRDRGPVPLSNTTRSICAQKTVLYLCGPEDTDRSKMHRWGFRDENIIAVDLGAANVTAVRDSSGLAIQARLEDVVALWPRRWHIDVVSADLCCGLQASSMRLMIALSASSGVDTATVVAVNMQRGRESIGADARQQFEDAFGSKHRGLMWYMLALDKWVSFYQPRFVPQPQLADLSALARQHCDPVFDSYRASLSVMDSVVMRWFPFLYSLDSTVESRGRCRDVLRETFQCGYSHDISAVQAKGVKSRLAALRAVRTMKLQKQGA